MCNGGLLSNVVNAQLSICSAHKEVNDRFSPISTISQQSQITEWFLWAAQFPLLLAELIREFNQEFPITVSLVLGKGEDTSNIVVLGRLLLLGKITNDMTASGITLRLKSRVMRKEETCQG